MTRDEMLTELSVLYERFKNGMGWRDGNYEEALDMAIEILEAEQTEPIPHDDYVETGNDHLKASRYEPQTESVYTPVTCKRCPVHEQCSQEDWRECRYDYIADKLNDEPQTERRGRVMKTCGDCVNCEKVHPKDGKEFWACEEYGIVFLGMPADVTPPNDEPCEFWTNDPKQKNKNYNAIMKLF